MKKIIILTSGQPSINPRLVKEADLLSQKHDVTVVYQYWNQWATEADINLLKQKKWKAIRVGGDPIANKAEYFFTRVIHKISNKLCNVIGLKWCLPEFAMCRSFIFLYREAIKQRGDFYIGHNPGALAVTVRVSKKLKVKCGFDAEDFHRREYSDNPNHMDVRLKTFLENKFFPQTDYIVTSSPLIQLEYEKLFPYIKFKTILNVFSKSIREEPVQMDKQIRLFWFSQTIGHNRGLEEIVTAMGICNNPFLELHVLGNPRPNVVDRLNSLAKNYNLKLYQLTFYPPIPPDKIPHLAKRFDIGMATEIGVPYNRDICLTNKIFTYIQCGLAIIASDTSAQSALIKAHGSIGATYQLHNIQSLVDVLNYFLNHPEELIRAKRSSYQLAQECYNWELECTKLQNLIDNLLDTNS